MLNTRSVTALVAAFEVSVNQNTGQFPCYNESTVTERSITSVFNNKTKQIVHLYNTPVHLILCYKIRCTRVSEPPHLQL